jgi:hypothetical protein
MSLRSCGLPIPARKDRTKPFTLFTMSKSPRRKADGNDSPPSIFASHGFSSLCFTDHVLPSLFLLCYSLLATSSYSPSPMRSGRSAGIGARVLRAPGRSCHDRQAGCRFLRAGSAYDRLRISGRARSGAPCVTATRRSPLGAPPWRFLDQAALCPPRAVPSGSGEDLPSSPRVILTRRTATQTSRGSVANRRHAGLPHPAPPNRTASGRRPS